MELGFHVPYKVQQAPERAQGVLQGFYTVKSWISNGSWVRNDPNFVEAHVSRPGPSRRWKRVQILYLLRIFLDWVLRYLLGPCYGARPHCKQITAWSSMPESTMSMDGLEWAAKFNKFLMIVLILFGPIFILCKIILSSRRSLWSSIQRAMGLSSSNQLCMAKGCTLEIYQGEYHTTATSGLLHLCQWRFKDGLC